jgi:hypothetical protein
VTRLLRLYPRRWRERYGPEFEALLGELPLSLSVVLDVARGAVRAHLSAPVRGDAVPVIPGGGLMLDLRHRFPDARPLGVVGLLLVLPTTLFIINNVMVYGLHLSGPFDGLVRLVESSRPIEYALVVAPFAALLLAALPIVGVRIAREAGSVSGTLSVETRVLNLVVGLLSGVLCALLVAYWISENLLGRGA